MTTPFTVNSASFFLGVLSTMNFQEEQKDKADRAITYLGDFLIFTAEEDRKRQVREPEKEKGKFWVDENGYFHEGLNKKQKNKPGPEDWIHMESSCLGPGHDACQKQHRRSSCYYDVGKRRHFEEMMKVLKETSREADIEAEKALRVPFFLPKNFPCLGHLHPGCTQQHSDPSCMFNKEVFNLRQQERIEQGRCWVDEKGVYHESEHTENLFTAFEQQKNKEKERDEEQERKMGVEFGA